MRSSNSLKAGTWNCLAHEYALAPEFVASCPSGNNFDIRSSMNINESARNALKIHTYIGQILVKM